jgi:hypothetical protein
MCRPDNAHPCIPELLNIAPVKGVCHGIAYVCKILVPVGTHKFVFKRLIVQKKSILTLKFNFTYPYSCLYSVCNIIAA